jgi:hypothetical protein
MAVRIAGRAGGSRAAAPALLLAILAVIGATPGDAQSPVHDRAFWVSLRDAGYRLPQNESALPLALEAAALLGSTDPELRDDIAYGATAVASRTDTDPAPFLAWFERLAAEHAAVWSGAFDPRRYVPVRAQLNTLAALAADLDATSGPAERIRAALRSLRAEAQ